MNRTIHLSSGPFHIFLLTLFLLLPIQVSAEPMRVTLLLEHASQSTYTQLLQEGLNAAAKKYSLATSVLVEADEEKQEAVFQAAAAKSELVLVASDRFHEILRDNARRFPKTRFGVIDAGIRGANISCITFADEQAAYLAGAAAALFSTKSLKSIPGKDPAIGWLSGEDIPAMRSMFNGYREGAQLIDPSVRVIHAVAGSFDSPEASAREAERMIQEGVRVLVLGAGAGNAAALDVAKKAQIYVIALDSEQSSIYPGHVLLSIKKDVAAAVQSLISDLAQQSFKAKEIEVYDLKHGVSISDVQKSLGQHLPHLGDISRRLSELTHELETGGIQLKSLRQKTLCNCL